MHNPEGIGPNVAFLGDLTVDNHVNAGIVLPGGSSLNSAAYAKRLHAHVSVVAAVGQDEFGAHIIGALDALGVDHAHVHRLPGRTSTIRIITTKAGNRMFDGWDPGVMEINRFTRKDMTWVRKQDGVGLVVYGPTIGLLDQLAADRRKHKKGHKPVLLVDFDDLSQFPQAAHVVEPYMDVVDVFVFGLKAEDEEKINQLQEFSRQYNKLVIITLGEDGVIATRGDEVYPYVGRRARRVVDTTGAGDAFVAGFLVQYLLDSEHIMLALRQGADLGAQAVEKVGA